MEALIKIVNVIFIISLVNLTLKNVTTENNVVNNGNVINILKK